MHKPQRPYLILGFGLLLAVVIAILTLGGRRSAGTIVLPEDQSGPTGPGGAGGQSTVQVVEVTPETVRTAVATLSRPAAYSQTQTVETFWSGGSGQTVSTVSVSGDCTRLDTQLVDGSVRHMLFDGDLAAVWYDDETDWTELQSSELTPDRAARTLTYEDVVDLPDGTIAAADYRERDGVRCIYVETAPDGAGYTSCYWVAVDTGLLCAAERWENETMVYRFSAGAPDSAAQDGSLFLLPDGTALNGGAGTAEE